MDARLWLGGYQGMAYKKVVSGWFILTNSEKNNHNTTSLPRTGSTLGLLWSHELSLVKHVALPFFSTVLYSSLRFVARVAPLS